MLYLRSTTEIAKGTNIGFVTNDLHVILWGPLGVANGVAMGFAATLLSSATYKLPVAVSSGGT